MVNNVVIVGASLAGGAAAATLRDEGFDGSVILIGAEPHAPYERPALSREYLQGDVPFEQCLVHPPDFYADHGIETRFEEQVVQVDPRARVVELAGGDHLPFDRVLVATGARNRKIQVGGFDLEGVHQLRTLEDADRIRAEAAAGRRAVVVGMGFIGAEVAASLRATSPFVVARGPVSRGAWLAEQSARSEGKSSSCQGIEARPAALWGGRAGRCEGAGFCPVSRAVSAGFKLVDLLRRCRKLDQDVLLARARWDGTR